MATRLFQCESVEEQWRAVVLPWLQVHAEAAWRDARPTVILTPGRGESFYLRGRWLEENRGLFGVRFWTPSDARAFLLGPDSAAPIPASRAECRLAARVAAEELLATGNAKEPSLRSVSREPEPFLNAYDLLLGAGWSPAKEGAPYGRKLAARFDRLLHQAGIATQAGVHRALRLRPASTERPPIANLLIVGFNASHWPLWDLIRATVGAAEKSTISLLKPRAFAEQTDQLWIGSWEEAFGPVTEISSDAGEDRIATPFAAWVGAYEKGGEGALKEGSVVFIATAELSAQVDAIVLQALGWLREKSCQRLGIVFPEANALSLGVAERLRRLGAPFDDGTGYRQPGLFEKRAWQAWLALQEEPSVERLTAWVRACEAESISWGAPQGLSARGVAETLDFALGETLVDDLDFLALYLDERVDRTNARDVADFLRRRVQLPDDVAFADFLAATRTALATLGWGDHLARIEVVAPAWLAKCGWKMSRRTFLAWLAEAADSREMARGPDSNHFYGHVHLLIYAHLPGRTWTHLILTGLNEGRWPRAFEAGAFGSKHELTLLNRNSRGLNRLATKQGRQGEGHEAVRDDRGHCLLPLERQELALRDLCAAVESASAGIGFTAMTQDAGRALAPSDFFAQAWQARTGEVLDETAFSALAARTLETCRKRRGLLSGATGDEEKISATEVESTHIAYAARRDPKLPFGRYEFAYATPPREPIQLPCKEWENAWNHPAPAWLANVVGVGAWPEGQLGWARAVGTWSHRWLASALKGCDGDPENFLPLLRRAAEGEAQRIRGFASRAGIEPYPWWEHVWGQARSIALGIGENLSPALAGRRFRSEYRLPPGLRVALPGTDISGFELRGRIDLLLVEPGSPAWDADGEDFSGCSCWIVDFKTGSSSSALTKGKLEKGAGLQAYLYALAVHARGGEGVAVSLQTFDAPLQPQIQIAQVLAGTALFRGLGRLHRDGIFGMRPDADNEYGFAPDYPMATRFTDREILAAKWKLVHGDALAPEENES